MTLRVMRETDWDILRRKHVLNGWDWSDAVGTDYWLMPGAAVAGATTFLNSSRGWTTTALSITEGAAADAMTYADRGTPRFVSFGASGDLIASPIIFGDYAGARNAAMLMGRSDLPRYLVTDVYGAFTTNSANENTSGFGLIEDGGAITTAADQLAVIVSDGTNFICRSGADSDAGSVVDTAYHWWRIVIDAQKTGGVTDAVEWFIDGVSQGTLDLETDEFPALFSAHSLTTNRISLGTTHIYYAWSLQGLDKLTA